MFSFLTHSVANSLFPVHHGVIFHHPDKLIFLEINFQKTYYKKVACNTTFRIIYSDYNPTVIYLFFDFQENQAVIFLLM